MSIDSLAKKYVMSIDEYVCGYSSPRRDNCTYKIIFINFENDPSVCKRKYIGFENYEL